MRSMSISTAAFLIIIVFWYFFMGYCEVSLADLNDNIQTDMVVALRKEDWQQASHSFDVLDKKWHENKVYYCLFLDDSAILNADFSVARLKAYIECRDQSASLGELSALSEQIKFLFLNERISLENIF